MGEMVSLWMALLLAAGQERVVETVVAGAAPAAGCSETVEIANAGSRRAAVEIEMHRESGALVAIDGSSIELAPGERRSYALDAGTWTGVRERIPSPQDAPVAAARGVTVCVLGDRAVTSVRDPAFPMRNPWYAGEVSAPEAVVLLINAGEAPVRASACYSAGNLYAVPGSGGEPPAFEPVCSETVDVKVPPFAVHEFPVALNGSRWFGLRTRGPSIVLQMLRPVDDGGKLFVVDSSIRFGGEVMFR